MVMHEQVRNWLASRKWSAPCTSVARFSARAVPMALVPRRASDHSAPARSATLSALARKSSSPSECRIRPSASVRMTMLCVFTIWS
ncbi:hypothetical protein D3C72_1501940 [compost metagenome]